MKAIFQNRCNFLSEAKYFLMRYYADEDFMKLDEALKKKSNYSESTRVSLEVLQEIYDEVKEAVCPIPEDLSVYFKPYIDESVLFNCIADGMLLEGEFLESIASEDIVTYIKQRFHTNNKMFIRCILDPEGSNNLEAMNSQMFLKNLEESTIPEEGKWNIWRVFANFDKHVDFLMSSISKIIPVMEKVYKKQENQFIEFYTEWKRTCEEQTFFAHLKTMFPIDMKENESDETVTVSPTWMACNSLRLFGVNDDNSERLLIHIGVLFKEIDKLTNAESFTREDICSRLKLLGDTSKYEILTLTKNEKLYGSQLAERLNLTTATISHHVSNLTSVGLITIQKDSNRVYYRSNREKIGFIIDQLRKDLYED